MKRRRKTTNPATIRRRLQELGERANAHADGLLNHGGCCSFAAIVAARLLALGIPARGVVATYAGQDVDAQRPADNTDPAAWNRNGINFMHVGLEIELDGEPWLFDSEGLVRRKDAVPRLTWSPGSQWLEKLARPRLPAYDAPVIPGYLSVDELAGLASHPRAWNRMFNRGCLPELEELAAALLPA